jgi:hypothetical protein
VRQAGNVTPQDGDRLFDYLPDPNFQTALMSFSGINKSGNAGEFITVADAKAVGVASTPNFWMENNKIASAVGFELFENVTKIDFGTTSASTNHNTIPILDLSRNTKLTNLTISRMTELTYVDFSGCAALTTLTANYTGLVELDFSSNPALTTIQCNGGNASNGTGDVGCLQKINLTGCPKLTGLQLSCNLLKELDISQNPLLGGTIYLRNNYLKTLDFSHLKSVTTLYLMDNSLESVILPKRTQAESASDLTVQVGNDAAYGTGKSNNNLSMLDASGCWGARVFRFAGLPNFQMLYVPVDRHYPTPDIQPDALKDAWTAGPPPTAGQ